MPTIPTIKGIFVNSHIKIVRERKGDAGIKKLEELFGKPVKYSNYENVPVAEEVKLLECVLQVLSDTPIPPEQVAFEAGRLHFNDFVTTPLAKILFSAFHDPEMLLRMEYIAEHVFMGITFTPQRLGPEKIIATMHGGIYPLDHFRGLFHAWVAYLGYDPVVEAVQLGPETYQYTISWTKKNP